MRQPGQHAVPEHDHLYPLAVQLKGDSWHVFDARTGGFGERGFSTYAEAETHAKELKAQDTRVAIA
ncbi:hypothetical protein KZJ38_07390 [Paraburkholderia edwinii]|uniref:WGR domain-containing protein n=1 Tax=Paraburkholderia edwinii TaxID=2861782 RepID=A0ABX8UME9_9BURK|nr:hypothetical protein [Paraburkholderia edwinii]QYD70124.1 hypothetical protein KZJ38_07390 [Paraburkholderia edwinii]